MKINPFNQPGPELGNQYLEDRVLRSYLRRALPADMLAAVETNFLEMGDLSGDELYQLQLNDRLNEPRLTQWSPWGERIDEIELTPLWKRAEQISAEKGLVAIPYEKAYGRFSRIIQFTLVYLFHPSSDVYTCPLAMSDGAAKTLLRSGNTSLIERALPHLTTRDPRQFWTSGQWMTESTGGSDVGSSETIAHKTRTGQWRLYGRKWFTSATTSQMTLTLARPEGNPPRGKGLALFYLETRNERGILNRIKILRLKDKLGTRKVPTAELLLEGTPAQLVYGTDNGVHNIIPMLHITRTWNSITTVATMRRGIALARDYAAKRSAFGAPLSQQPLHLDTLAALQAEFEAAFHLSFYLIELLGRDEAGELTEPETALLRMLTSVVKLTTGRAVVPVISEVLESFGGAGYVEDTGLPLLLRDSQVFPIWEGTTNVLSLDTLKALREPVAIFALQERFRKVQESLRTAPLPALGEQANQTLARAIAWLNSTKEDKALQAGARGLAQTLGRSLALALLAEHAQWAIDHEQDPRPLAAAQRFAVAGINLIRDADLSQNQALANDMPLNF